MIAKVSKILVLLFIGVFLFSAVNRVDSLGVTGTIPVGNPPMGIAYESAKGEIFVPTGNGFSNAVVTVISDSTKAISAAISNFNEAQIAGLAYDSARNQIFVALHQSNYS